MSASDAPLDIVDNPDRGRYELRDGDALVGQARYVVVTDAGQPDRVVFFHTEVDDAYGGRGLAGDLAAKALDDTVAAGSTIVAVCPYIAMYVKRHRDTYGEHVSPTQPSDLKAVQAAVGGR